MFHHNEKPQERELNVKVGVYFKENDNEITEFEKKFNNAGDAVNWIKEQRKPLKWKRGPNGYIGLIYLDTLTNIRYLITPHRENLSFLALFDHFDLNAETGAETKDGNFIEGWSKAIWQGAATEAVFFKDNKILLPDGKYKDIIETGNKDFLEKAKLDIKTKTVETEYPEVGEELLINRGGFNERITSYFTQEKKTYSLESGQTIIIKGEGEPKGIDLEGGYTKEGIWKHFNREVGVLNLKTQVMKVYQLNKKTNKPDFIKKYKLPDSKLLYTGKFLTLLLNTYHDKKLGGKQTKSKRWILNFYKKLVNNPKYETDHGVENHLEFRKDIFGKDYFSAFTAPIKD